MAMTALAAGSTVVCAGAGLRADSVGPGTSTRLRSDVWGWQLKSIRNLNSTARLNAGFPLPIVSKKSQRAVNSEAENSSTVGGNAKELARRISAGEFTVSSVPQKRLFPQLRQKLLKAGAVGRSLSLALATRERQWRLEKRRRMPEARGDVKTIVGEPFFVPLYCLFRTYGGVFRLTFGPKSFAIVSDPAVTKHVLKDNAKSYSKGILAEILEFVMGTGLIPADGEIWRVRRRAIVPSLHIKYVTAMLGLFGQSTARLCDKISTAASNGEDVEMENYFSRLTLDIIGKSVFNYEFDSLTNDTGIVEAVYVTLKEATDRSTAIFPYWKIPVLAAIDSRQQKVAKALKLVNDTLDTLIVQCKQIVEEEGEEFHEEYVNERDPSILHFLLASGDEVTSKQLRDDLVTLLIAGHETSAAVLTWTFYLLALNPSVTAKLQREVDTVLGDREPTIDDMKKLRYASNVISESMRLYPQPPVLIRRALEDDMLGQFKIKKGQDIFISVWNLHRSPLVWEDADEFRPDRWDSYSTAEASQAFRYLPFGGGPRKCVGDVFATYETITALVMLTRRFNFELAAGAPPVTITAGATIHTKDGLHMTVTHRSRAPIFPVTDGASLTTVDANGLIKNYSGNNGSVSLLTSGNSSSSSSSSSIAASQNAPLE